MNIAIVGLGGIGSHLCRLIAEEQIIRNTINDSVEFVVFDYDKVDFKNLKYTTYTIKDIDKQKTSVISKKYGFKYIDKKVDNIKYFEDYQLVILCVDNNEIRKLIFEAKIPFIDLRAKGSAVCIYQLTDYTDKKFIKEYEKSLTDNEKSGCQYETDLNNNNIKYGMIISASIGLQLISEMIKTKALTNKKFIWSF